MMLEAAADSAERSGDSYEFAVTEGDPAEIDLRPMIRQMVADADGGKPQQEIAARFHATLVAAIAAVCRRMRDALQLNRVCLSGGCFQNARLLAASLETLRADGFEVFSHREVPANDGGISLGQAAIACELLRQDKSES
jgi:hydrogenase maturation protein HypF